MNQNGLAILLRNIKKIPFIFELKGPILSNNPILLMFMYYSFVYSLVRNKPNIATEIRAHHWSYY